MGSVEGKRTFILEEESRFLRNVIILAHVDHGELLLPFNTH